MKKLTLIALSAALVFTACKKNTYDNNNNPTPADSNSYIVNGITDFSVAQEKEFVMALSVTHEKGEQQQVTLSNGELPKGVYISFEPQKGIPAFASVVTIHTSDSTPVGIHHIKITASGNKSSKVKEFPVAMTVTKGAPCGFKLGGTYSVTKDCSLNGAAWETEVFGSSQDYNISFRSLPYASSWYSTKAVIDCDNRTVIIPPQMTVNTDSIMGTGTFNYTGMQITMVFKPYIGNTWSDKWSDTCRFTLNKK